MTTNEHEIQEFLLKKNLEIVENFEVGDPVPVTQSRLISLKDWNESSTLEEFRKKGATGGIRQAFYDLNHSDEIPKNERDLIRVYTQTILRCRDSGYLFVLFLYRYAGDGEWYLRLFWLGYVFESVFRAVGRAGE